MNKALLKVTELTTYYISLLFVLFRFMLTGIAGLNYFIFIALSILAGVLNYKRIRGTGNPFQGSENMERRKVFGTLVFLVVLVF